MGAVQTSALYLLAGWMECRDTVQGLVHGEGNAPNSSENYHQYYVLLGLLGVKGGRFPQKNRCNLGNLDSKAWDLVGLNYSFSPPKRQLTVQQTDRLLARRAQFFEK